VFGAASSIGRVGVCRFGFGLVWLGLGFRSRNSMPAQPIRTASVCCILCRPFPVRNVLRSHIAPRHLVCRPMPTLALAHPRPVTFLPSPLPLPRASCLGCTFEGKHTEWLPHCRGHRPVPAAVRCDWTAPSPRQCAATGRPSSRECGLKGSRCHWCSTARFDPNFYQHPRRRKGQCLAFSAALPRCWLDSLKASIRTAAVRSCL
jgi:hypothetical protein